MACRRGDLAGAHPHVLETIRHHADVARRLGAVPGHVAGMTGDLEVLAQLVVHALEPAGHVRARGLARLRMWSSIAPEVDIMWPRSSRIGLA